MAAPTCTQATTTKVTKLIKVGIPPVVAAQATGIAEGDFVEWMRKGQLSGSGHGNYRQFYEGVVKADADFEAGLIERIASAKDWKAAAWLAERRFPERYTRRPVGESADKKATAGDGDPWSTVDGVVPIHAVK